MSILVIVTVTVLLSVTAVLALVRIVRGPSLLDRVVGSEVLLAVIVAAVGAEAAINRRATTLPVLVVLSLLGFAGSVSIVRFAAGGVVTWIPSPQDGALRHLPDHRRGAEPGGGDRADALPGRPCPDARLHERPQVLGVLFDRWRAWRCG